MTGKKKVLVMLLSLSFLLSSLYVFAQDDVRATGKEDNKKTKEGPTVTFYTADGKKKEVEFDPEGEAISIEDLALNSQLIKYPEEVRYFSDAKYSEGLDGSDSASEDLTVYLVDGDQYIVSFHMVSFKENSDGIIERVKSEAKAIKAIRAGDNPLKHLGSGYKSYKWYEDMEANKLAKSVNDDGELYAFSTIDENEFYSDPKTGILVKIDPDGFDSNVVNLVMQRKPIQYEVIGLDNKPVESNVYSLYFTDEEDEKIAPNKTGAFQVWLPIPEKGIYEDYEVLEINSDKVSNNTLYKAENMAYVAYQGAISKSGGSRLYKSLVIRDENIAKDYTYIVAKTFGHGDKYRIADPNIISGKIPNPNTAMGILNQAPPEANLSMTSKVYSLPNGSIVRECAPSGIKFTYPPGTFLNDTTVLPELYALNYSVGTTTGPIRNVAFTVGFKDGSTYVDPRNPIEIEVPYSGLNASSLDILRQTGDNSYATVAGVVSNANVRFSLDRSGIFVLAESYNVDKSQLKLVNLGVYKPTASQIRLGNGYMTPVTGEEDWGIYVSLLLMAAGTVFILKKKFA